MYPSDKEKIACSMLEIVDEITEFMDHYNSLEERDSKDNLLRLELGDILYGMAILSEHYDIEIENDSNVPKEEYVLMEDFYHYSGTLAGIIKKTIRDDNYVLTDTKNRRLKFSYNMNMLYKTIITLCSDYGWNFSDILNMNIEKLFDRKERGVIQGSGDLR